MTKTCLKWMAVFCLLAMMTAMFGACTDNDPSDETTAATPDTTEASADTTAGTETDTETEPVAATTEGNDEATTTAAITTNGSEETTTNDAGDQVPGAPSGDESVTTADETTTEAVETTETDTQTTEETTDDPEPAPALRVDTTTASAGETVEVAVYLENNPGIHAVTIGFIYDVTRLELTNVTLADGIEGSFIYINKAVWCGTSDNMAADGAFLIMHFTVLDDAPAGDAMVSATYNDGDICNYDEEDVRFDLISGGITIA